MENNFLCLSKQVLTTVGLALLIFNLVQLLFSLSCLYCLNTGIVFNMQVIIIGYIFMFQSESCFSQVSGIDCSFISLSRTNRNSMLKRRKFKRTKKKKKKENEKKRNDNQKRKKNEEIES